MLKSSSSSSSPSRTSSTGYHSVQSSSQSSRLVKDRPSSSSKSVSSKVASPSFVSKQTPSNINSNNNRTSVSRTKNRQSVNGQKRKTNRTVTLDIPSLSRESLSNVMRETDQKSDVSQSMIMSKCPVSLNENNLNMILEEFCLIWKGCPVSFKFSIHTPVKDETLSTQKTYHINVACILSVTVDVRNNNKTVQTLGQCARKYGHVKDSYHKYLNDACRCAAINALIKNVLFWLGMSKMILDKYMKNGVINTDEKIVSDNNPSDYIPHINELPSSSPITSL